MPAIQQHDAESLSDWTPVKTLLCEWLDSPQAFYHTDLLSDSGLVQLSYSFSKSSGVATVSTNLLFLLTAHLFVMPKD